MLGWIVGGVRDDYVCESGFTLNGSHPIGGGPVECNVKVIHPVVELCFCSKLHVGVDRVEVIKYVIDACVVGVVDYRNVVNVEKVSCNLVLV